jgi:hypothetical protein
VRGVPSSEADPVRGRGGPSSEADLARGRRTPSNRAEPPEGGAHPRARRNLFEGVFEWAAWWAVGAFVARAMSCMVK